jgi:hypothetical protein
LTMFSSSATSTRGTQIARYSHLVTLVLDNNGTIVIIIIYNLLLTLFLFSNQVFAKFNGVTTPRTKLPGNTKKSSEQIILNYFHALPESQGEILLRG